MVPERIISVYSLEKHVWADSNATEARQTRQPELQTIEEFQFDNGIKPQNGDLDDPNNKKVKATLQKLVEVHGDKEPV